MHDLRVSLIQAATVWHDADANRALYGKLIRGLKGQTDLIVLPETFTSGFSNDAIHRAESMQGETVAWLRQKAAEVGAVITGSVVMRDGESVFNRLLWASPDGDVQHYDKRHLFRMAKEHERYAAGKERLIVSLHGWRICPLVCYDLRFPVFMRNGRDADQAGGMHYDLLLFVANWPAPRRHPWRTLLRARAIENLCYVVGVNRVGRDGNELDYAGDSAVIDMVGEALVDCGSEPIVVTQTLSWSKLQGHRDRFPAWMDADAFELRDC
ncbi:amidohydrolase [Ahniella affigens]|uniref:Omega-amidase YafV n=1 Tax=Ahniella affigens TaxID=2021234 RepID=A0A2P1PT14_9GAMM|nr:amidohydrolase [Ahniella affigens]AVP97983.1 amidohydrolase [Ahniella affigens]